MKSPRYDRNEFIFNFCVVLAEEDDFSTYKSVVQKLADMMHALEEQNGFLSRDFSKSGEGKVNSLCEMLMEDLNNYCECMIPIGRCYGMVLLVFWLTIRADDLNTLNIKLFPIYPSPPPVKAWQVPLFTVRYQAFMDENWDLTLQRVCMRPTRKAIHLMLTWTDCASHQWREQRPYHLYPGRYGLFSSMPRNSTLAILWLLVPVGYLLFLRYICTNGTI